MFQVLKARRIFIIIIFHLVRFHLPDYEDCGIKLMRVSSEIKRESLKISQIKLLVVPFYDSLSMKRNFSKVLDIYPGLENYFPIYYINYLPRCKFFWEVFGTLHYHDACKIIETERERKYEKEESNRKGFVEVSTKILNELQKVTYFSKKKGKALDDMKEKEFRIPTRKRRWKDIENSSDDDPDATPFVIAKLNATDKRVKKLEDDIEGNIEILHNRSKITNSASGKKRVKSKKNETKKDKNKRNQGKMTVNPFLKKFGDSL